MSFNKVIVVGNLGRDPELRYTPQGTAVCDFSIATNEKKRDKAGEMQNVTTWFRVTLWNKLAENASKYLTKGSPVYIEGRLRIEEWTDKDGKNRSTLEINGTDMQFLGGGSADGGGGGRRDDSHGERDTENDFSDTSDSAGRSGGGGGGNTSSGSPADDDIPF
jgi:single-strand DNA-binding protein